MPRTTPDGAPTEPPPSTDPEHRLEHETLTASRSLGGETEAALLGIMADKNDPEAARDAWDELYRRHVRYIHLLVARSFGRQLDDHAVSDVVVDTFRAAYEWARRQPTPAEVVQRFDDPDADLVRRRVLGWLGVIARRNAIHRARDARYSHAALGLDGASDSGRAEAPSSLASRLAGALSSLSPDELNVLTASLPWYDLETQRFQLPRGEASRLAAAMEMSVDAFRQRRHRALKRLSFVLGDQP